jgi:NAD(P)-dependent dehydrogenase (short-subunit alcohol dehydrogenase family)
VPTDVTDAAAMCRLADAAASAFGGIDVWINNAGMSMWGPFEAIPLEAQARLLEVNLLGAINGAHAVLPHLFARGGRGVIINTVSISGRVPTPWASTYTATKFGLAGFTDALRYELAAHSAIEVCGIYPAFTDTPTSLHSANYTGRSLRPVPRRGTRSARPRRWWSWRFGRSAPFMSTPSMRWHYPMPRCPSGWAALPAALVAASSSSPATRPPPATAPSSSPCATRWACMAPGASHSARRRDPP